MSDHRETIEHLGRQLYRKAVERSGIDPNETGDDLFGDDNEVAVYITGKEAKDILETVYGSQWVEACKAIARFEAIKK